MCLFLLPELQFSHSKKWVREGCQRCPLSNCGSGSNLWHYSPGRCPLCPATLPDSVPGEGIHALPGG